MILDRRAPPAVGTLEYGQYSLTNPPPQLAPNETLAATKLLEQHVEQLTLLGWCRPGPTGVQVRVGYWRLVQVVVTPISFF
jgi:hypothetical protein